MKKIWKTHYKKIAMIAGDLLIVPGVILCQWLSAWMLSTESVCTWVKFGGKCITCGGTHFVYSLSRGDIIEAFGHNQFLFALAVYFAVSLVFLNLFLLFDLRFAQKALRNMYSVPAVLLIVWGMLMFLFFRNIPLLIRIIHVIGNLLFR